MTRRRFLRQGTVAALGMMALTGCGGSGTQMAEEPHDIESLGETATAPAGQGLDDAPDLKKKKVAK